MLTGSVVRGQERPESDIDVNIFLPDDEVARHASSFIDADNRWQLKLIWRVQGVRIDVAWESYQGLLEYPQGDGAVHCWPFFNGRILYDPNG